MKAAEEKEAEPIDSLPAIIDIDAAEVKSFASVPVRAQQVALLLSFGWSARDIEKGFRLPKNVVNTYRSRYLDGAGLTISRRTRDVALATLMRAQASRLVAGITPEKIQKAGIGELAKSAAMLLQRAAALDGNDRAPDHAAQISRALSALSSNNNSDDTESAQAPDR
jgi:hypothetical protein